MKILITDIRAAAANRPPGYVEACFAASLSEYDGWLSLSSHTIRDLRHRFPPLNPPANDPSMVELSRNFATAVAIWVAAGLPVVTEETFQRRLSACLTCPSWDPEAYAGRGRCMECGCSDLKPALGTSKCPLGRWPERPVQGS